MKSTVYTLLICPGAHGALHRIPLPAHVVHLVLVFGLIGVISVTTLIHSYARMLSKVSHYNSLRTQHDALRRQYQVLENSAVATRTRLDSLESLAREIALCYGLSHRRRARVPSTLLAIWAQNRDPLGPKYSASLCAFNLLGRRRVALPGEPLAHAAFLEALHGSPAIPSLWPVRGEVSAGFGQRMDPFTGEGAFHAGIDIAAPVGTPVVATAEGILFHVGPNAGYGNDILIDHGYGIVTKYSHLSKTFVAVGRDVSRGQVIGTVGMTGRATGPHLHYEVLVHDAPVNPAKYLPKETDQAPDLTGGNTGLLVSAVLNEPVPLRLKPASLRLSAGKRTSPPQRDQAGSNALSPASGLLFTQTSTPVAISVSAAE